MTPGYAEHQSTGLKQIMSGLKAACVSNGFGKVKLRPTTPPSWQAAGDTERLAMASRVLAGRAGQLSDDRIFRHRVAQPLSAVNALCTDRGVAPQQGLTGFAGAFFRGGLQ
jgi:hypothetical protein